MTNYSVNIGQGIKIATSVSVNKVTEFYLDWIGFFVIILLILLTICFSLLKHFLISWLEEKFHKRKAYVVGAILLIIIALLIIIFLLGGIEEIIKVVPLS